jgi:hypothetical protein
VAIAVRTRAQASPSRPIAQIRSGIVRGSLRLPTQIVEEPHKIGAQRVGEVTVPYGRKVGSSGRERGRSFHGHKIG